MVVGSNFWVYTIPSTLLLMVVVGGRMVRIISVRRVGSRAMLWRIASRCGT